MGEGLASQASMEKASPRGSHVFYTCGVPHCDRLRVYQVLVHAGIPDHLRSQLWQELCGASGSRRRERLLYTELVHKALSIYLSLSLSLSLFLSISLYLPLSICLLQLLKQAKHLGFHQPAR